MAPRRATVTPKKNKITFSILLPDVQEVALCGDFNQWSTTSHPMKRSAKGLWSKALYLAPGRYEYKFLVDGKWMTDPKNPQVARNPFGTVNNVLVVAA